MADRKTNIVTWLVDGTPYQVDLYDIDGIEWRDAKRVTGLGQIELQVQAIRDKDFEAIAALLWIVRRRDNPSLSYEDVLGGLTYASMLPEGDEEPEADPPA